MNDSLQELAIRIQAARKQKGLSQRALSVKVGIPQSHLSKIEKGRVDLQTSSLIQIARALDLELVLVSRTQLSAVQAIQKSSQGTNIAPAYQLPSDEEDT